MARTLLLLCLGAAVGYAYGFKDSKAHDKTVVERALDRAGGAARGKYDGNVDRGADSVGR